MRNEGRCAHYTSTGIVQQSYLHWPKPVHPNAHPQEDNKLWLISTAEYGSTTKRNELLATKMNPAVVMLRERSQIKAVQKLQAQAKGLHAH